MSQNELLDMMSNLDEAKKLIEEWAIRYGGRSFAVKLFENYSDGKLRYSGTFCSEATHAEEVRLSNALEDREDPDSLLKELILEIEEQIGVASDR